MRKLRREESEKRRSVERTLAREREIHIEDIRAMQEQLEILQRQSPSPENETEAAPPDEPTKALYRLEVKVDRERRSFRERNAEKENEMDKLRMVLGDSKFDAHLHKTALKDQKEMMEGLRSDLQDQQKALDEKKQELQDLASTAQRCIKKLRDQKESMTAQHEALAGLGPDSSSNADTDTPSEDSGSDGPSPTALGLELEREVRGLVDTSKDFQSLLSEVEQDIAKDVESRNRELEQDVAEMRRPRRGSSCFF